MKTNDLRVYVVGRISFVSAVFNMLINRNISNSSYNKNKFLSIALLILLCACSTTVIRNDALIGLNKKKHDFGTIAYKKVAACTFEFSNTGKSALVIYGVKTSCGCTVPEWTKAPIRPGKKGVLKIKYDATFPGIFQKTVEVTYNGPGSPISLEINGEVEYPENIKL
jgi:hypothetical protein